MENLNVLLGSVLRCSEILPLTPQFTWRNSWLLRQLNNVLEARSSGWAPAGGRSPPDCWVGSAPADPTSPKESLFAPKRRLDWL